MSYIETMTDLFSDLLPLLSDNTSASSSQNSPSAYSPSSSSSSKRIPECDQSYESSPASSSPSDQASNLTPSSKNSQIPLEITYHQNSFDFSQFQSDIEDFFPLN